MIVKMKGRLKFFSLESIKKDFFLLDLKKIRLRIDVGRKRLKAALSEKHLITENLKALLRALVKK